MSIDFPAPATDGQIFSAANGVVYKYSAAYSSWLAQNPAPPIGGTGDFCAYLTGAAVGTTFATPTLTNILSGNSGGWYSAGRYTPPAGRYCLYGYMSGSSSTGSSLLQIKLRKNGTDVPVNASNSSTAAANTTTETSFTLTQDANGADWFDIQVLATITAVTTQIVFGAYPLTGMQGPTGGAPGPVVGDFMAFTNSAGSSTTPVTILFNTIITGNSGGYYNPATGRHTPPAGRYRLQATLWGYSSAGGTTIQLYIRKNGTPVTVSAPAQATAGANNYSTITFECLVDANGTDWFDVQQQATAALSGSLAYFSAFPTQGMVGPQGPMGPAFTRPVMQMYDEIVLAAPAIDMRVNVPTNAKAIEIWFFTNQGTADTLLMNPLNGATIQAANVFRTQYFYGAGSTTTAGFSTTTSWQMAGSVAVVNGVFRPTWVPASTAVLATSNLYAQNLLGTSVFAMASVYDCSGIVQPTGYRLSNSTQSFAAGSWMRAMVMI